MTRRYVTRAVDPSTWGHPYDDPWWHENPPGGPPVLVFERDSEPQRTGLLDKNGLDLFRVEDRNPIGFHARLK